MQPTALEYLCVLTYILCVFAHHHESKTGDLKFPHQLFLCKWVIEQSVASYELLGGLLEQTGRLIDGAADQREREMYIFIFDNFAKILLNNLNALYQSDRAYLDIVFEQKKNKLAKQYVQTEYYPKVLRRLIWRTQLTEEDKRGVVSFLTDWQKVMPIEDAAAMKSLYEALETEDQEELVNRHRLVCARSFDFEKELPLIIELMAFKKTAENE